MKNSIIRFEDTFHQDFIVRRIFGMNILRANKVLNDINPEFEFFEFLSRTNITAAHTGSLHDIADSPAEIFGLPDEFLHYDLINVGVFGGAFYSTVDWSLFPPCFFPAVDSKFWLSESRPRRSHLQEILSWDALALYVNPTNAAQTGSMPSLVHEGYVSSDKWVETALSHYGVVIVSVGDGSYLKAYARSTIEFEVLDSSLNKVENELNAFDWIQRNKSNMIWDKDCTCLMLA